MGNPFHRVPVIQRRQRWGLFLRLPILYPLPTSLRRRWVTSHVPFSHLKEEVGVEEPCCGENPRSSDSQVLESQGEGYWGKVTGLIGRQVGTTAMLLPHQLLCFEAVFREFLLHWRGIWECEVRLLFFFFPLFLLAVCDICFLPWDLQLQSTPSLCTLKIYFYVGTLRYLVGVRWVVSGRGKREKAVGIFFPYLKTI